jgi:hypothetical protein
VHDLIRRLVVLLRAAPTWLVAAAVIVTIIAERVAELLPWIPDGTATATAAWLFTLAGALTAAAAVVRRVTPVLTEARGLLPPDDDRPYTPGEAAVRADLERLLRITGASRTT